MNQSFNPSRQQGFSYIEVLVASLLVVVALVPAMNALQTGIKGANVHQAYTAEYYSQLKKMEELQATPFTSLLNAAKTATNNITPTSFSDASGTANRNLVYIALYDADASPFTITDTNVDGDNDPYTGNTANLLWLKVMTEGSVQGLETLISR